MGLLMHGLIWYQLIGIRFSDMPVDSEEGGEKWNVKFVHSKSKENGMEEAWCEVAMLLEHA